MNVAGSVPKHHIAAGNTINVRTKIAVWAENYRLVLRKTLHYLTCVAAGYDHIRYGFGCSRSVYV